MVVRFRAIPPEKGEDPVVATSKGEARPLVEAEREAIAAAEMMISDGLTLTVNILSCILLAMLAYEARNRVWQCLLLLALLALSIWRVVDQVL